MQPDELKHTLETLMRTAWQPQSGPAVPGARSKFGGQPLLITGEERPCCGHCHQPMQLFLQLDSSDLPRAAGQPFGDGVLQVFYCTNTEEDCEILAEAHLPFSDATLCRVIPREQADGFEALPGLHTHTFAERSLTGWAPLEDYPDRADASPIQAAPRHALSPWPTHTAPPHAGDKFLGWPHWAQTPNYPLCSCCQQPMRFVLQLDSTDNLPFWFGDSGCAHVFQCDQHPSVLTLSWASRGE